MPRGLAAVCVALAPCLAAQDALPSAPRAQIEVGDGFEALVREVFQETLARAHVAGGVFGLVDGQRTTLMGFGVADLATQEKVHPQSTLFHVASLTKAVTAVAVLQLAEEGRVELGADVIRWLDGWQLAPPGGAAVTLHQLLTHTAGFDDRNVGRASRTWSQAPELGALLRRTAPPFAFAPGEVCSYSNWGFTLAGYVVERASGKPFLEYVAERVLAPLGMEHSTLRLPDEGRSGLATGYDWLDGENVPEAPFLDVGGGGSMLVTTAEDYCRFIAALLGEGELNGARILRPESVARLLARQFTHDPRLAGSAYGFFERFQNGHRILEHSGHMPGFVSQVCLLPDDDVGFFFSLNSAGSNVRLGLLERLLDALLGPPAPVALPELPGSVDARIPGTWRSTVYSRATLEKVMSLFDQFEIGVGGDGRLTLWYDSLRQVAPDAYEPADGRLYLAPGPVVFDLEREPARFYVGRNSYERVPWIEALRVQLVALATLGGVFLLAALGWPLAALVARLRARPLDPAVREARRWAWWASVLDLAFLGGAVLIVREAIRSNGAELVYGVPLSNRLLLTLPLAAAVLTAFSAVATVRVWRRSIGSRLARWQLTVVTLACLAFLALLQLWNLLGYHW